MRTLVKSGAGSAVVHAAALGGLLLIDPAASELVTIDLTIMASESMEAGRPGEDSTGPPSPSAPAPSVPRVRAASRLERQERTVKRSAAVLPSPAIASAQAIVAPNDTSAPEPAAVAPEATPSPGDNQGEGSLGTESTGAAKGRGTGSQGVASAASGAGSGQGAAGPHQTYLARHYAYIRDAIQRSAAYPPLARRMGWVGRVVLAFRILPDGAVANVRVVNGSGFPVLDSSAIQAVRRASPFPRPPAEAEIVAPVAYALE